MIPEPLRPEPSPETEKVQKSAKISRKRRNFAAMLGDSTAVESTAFGTGTALTNDGMGAFQIPFGYSAGENQHMQQDESKFLEDIHQITPSDQAR